jgi:hypothetical protein
MEGKTMTQPSYANLPSDDELLARPDVSFWLKDAIRDSARRDVVDAYRDAEVLTAVLLRRVDTALGRLGCTPKGGDRRQGE